MSKKLVFILVLAWGFVGHAAESFGTCTKDKKEMKVEAADEAASKDACEAIGGVWKAKKDSSDTDKKDSKKEKSGGGGGW